MPGRRRRGGSGVPRAGAALLAFERGVLLGDPHGLLRGDGRTVRWIQLDTRLTAASVTPMTDANGVLLDVGGVLLPTPWELLEDFEARNGWPPGTLPWRGPLDPATDPLWRAAQAGQRPAGGYFERRAAELSGLLGRSLSWPEVTRVLFRTPAGLAVRPEGPPLVADARAAGLRTGLLTSKLLAFLSREVVERSEFLRSFDVLLDESETGVAKPDPRAYDQAAAAMGLDPAGIVFVDDDPANVAGAGAAGMAGVHFDITDPAGSFTRIRDRLGLAR